MEGEQDDDRDPREHRVRAEQIPEVPGVVAARVDRDAVHETRQADSPDQRRSGTPDGVAPRPERTPARGLALRAPLEGDDADDQEEEDEQERDVEAREHRRVPSRKRCERRAPGDDEPDLVPVPDGADRAQHRPPVFLALREERQQHPYPEVEALEQEIARPQDRDEHEPEGLEVHQYDTAGTENSSPSPPTSGGSRRA